MPESRVPKTECHGREDPERKGRALEQSLDLADVELGVFLVRAAAILQHGK